MRLRTHPVDQEDQLLSLQIKVEDRFSQLLANRSWIVESNIMVIGQPRDPSIKCTAIDVRETESPRELARDRAFPGSGRAVNRNHRKFGDGIGIQFFSKTSAGLKTGVGGFSSGVRNFCNCWANPGYEVAMQSVSSITVSLSANIPAIAKANAIR